MDRQWLLMRVSIGVAAAALLLQASAASAQFNVSFSQRAEDGTVYEVISVPTGSLQGGPDKVRITSVAGSQIGLQASPGIGNMSGDPVCALTGGDQLLVPPQVLHPFSDVLRTAVFTPSTQMPTFVPNGSGRVIFGDMEVCRQSSTCSGGVADVSVVDLTSSSGGVPAACVANGVTAPCASGTRSTIAFGLASTGNVCNSGQFPTTGSTICAVQPADGFDVVQGQVVVFIYDSGLAGTGFTIGAAGFGIDTNNVNDPGCASGQIVTAAALAQAAPAQPFTPTPTSTNTPTNTPTNTQTNTPTNTPTETPTPTPSNTFTPTPTNTATRPPVPLIPSPASPAGVLMIVALGAGLLWTLRRFGSAN